MGVGIESAAVELDDDFVAQSMGRGSLHRTMSHTFVTLCRLLGFLSLGRLMWTHAERR